MVWSGNVHVIQASDLIRSQDSCQHSMLSQNPADDDTRGVRSKESLTFRWPRKCSNSLISRNARLAKIFLLKILVIFLMATPSLVAF